MAISFPLIALAVDLSSADEGSRWGRARKKWQSYLIYTIVTLFYLGLRFYYFKNPQEKFDFHGERASSNFYTMVRVAAYYIKLAFIPTNLNADYVVNIPRSPIQAEVLVSYALIVAVIFLMIVAFRRSKGAFLGGAWFFIALGPVSNIVPIKIIMAERYLYLPSAGFVLLLGAAFAALSRAQGQAIYPRALKGISVTILALMVLSFSIVTFKRNYVWRDEYSLWSVTAKHSPISARAHTNLGIILVDRGRYDEAIKLLRYALRLKPGLAPTMNDLAVAFSKSGRGDKAVAEFKALLAIKPDFIEGHINLGKTFHARGMHRLAEAQFKKTIALDPDNPLARNNLGVVLHQLGNLDTALYQYIRATRSDPLNPDVHKNLGVTYLTYAKRDQKALYHFRETIRLNPGESQAKLIAAKIEELKKKVDIGSTK